jgi:four helix bundle protein
MRDFRNLAVWQRAHQLTIAIYTATKEFPREELYGLTSQIRRASSSIPANIAEGCGRSGQAEFARFLTIAMGSASELEYHLLLAHDLNYISLAFYNELVNELYAIKRMLVTLTKKLKANTH